MRSPPVEAAAIGTAKKLLTPGANARRDAWLELFGDRLKIRLFRDWAVAANTSGKRIDKTEEIETAEDFR